MTVYELLQSGNFEGICIADQDRKIKGVYCGDLLSWVMGKAEADNAWITIMSNVNVLAVASLVDVACVILSESVDIDEEVLKVATQKEINILKTSLTTYDAAVYLSTLL